MERGNPFCYKNVVLAAVLCSSILLYFICLKGHCSLEGTSAADSCAQVCACRERLYQME